VRRAAPLLVECYEPLATATAGVFVRLAPRDQIDNLLQQFGERQPRTGDVLRTEILGE
jgi:hypothetical protein